QPMRRTNDDTGAVLPSGRRAARERRFTGGPRRGCVMPTLLWWPIPAARNTSWHTRRCDKRPSAVPQADRPVTVAEIGHEQVLVPLDHPPVGERRLCFS